MLQFSDDLRKYNPRLIVTAVADNLGYRIMKSQTGKGV